MMGAREKKKGQKTLAILKKAAIIIAILDLILTVNDGRNVGRFFLLVTMSNIFDITPENVIGDHCQGEDNLGRSGGICETYAQMMETGSLPFPSSEMVGRNFHPPTTTTTTATRNNNNNHNNNAADAGGADGGVGADTSYLKATLSIQRLPEMFKELVTSWKSTFDPSRTDVNISFYFDDDEVPGLHKQQLPQPAVKHQHHHPAEEEDSWHPHHSSISTSSSSSVLSSSSLNSHHKNIYTNPTSSQDEKSIPSLNQRPSSHPSALGESHEYKQDDEKESHINSHDRDIEHHDFVSEGSSSSLGNVPFHHSTTPRNNDVNDKTDDIDISKPPLYFSKNHQEIGSNRKKRFTQQPLQQQQQPSSQSTSGGEKKWRKQNRSGENIPISQSNNNIEVQQGGSFMTLSTREPDLGRETTSSSTLKTTPVDKRTRNPKSGISSRGKINSTSSSSNSNGGGNDNLKPGGGEVGPKRRLVVMMGPKEKKSEGEEEEKCSKYPGPKKMIGFLQQEMFSRSRWQSLLQTAEALINPGGGNLGNNLCIGEQLGSPEASGIKMHIELSPFGPKPFKEAERRVKATQQILFDSPWLTMIQLYSKLSGGFIKIFIVITIYTWIWGTLLGLMLLIGTVTEEPIMIHGWIIFNIAYSLLFFMIDDWIHTNINPCRSTVSMWLSIAYSLYKPLATWVVLMQWSEMKKLVSTTDDSSPPHCLDTTTMKFVTPRPSSSNTSLSSDTTKESTIVDLNITDIGSTQTNIVEKESNTAAALMLAVSTLRLGSGGDHNHQKQGGDYDDFEEGCEEDDDGDYEEEGDDDDDTDDDDDDDDDEGGTEEDERRDLESGEIETNNTVKLDSAGERSDSGGTIMSRGRNNGYIVTH